MPVQDDYRRKLVSAADAAASVPSGVQVLVAMGLGAPPAVLAALADRVRADELLDLDLYYGMGGDAIGDTNGGGDVESETCLPELPCEDGSGDGSVRSQQLLIPYEPAGVDAQVRLLFLACYPNANMELSNASVGKLTSFCQLVRTGAPAAAAAGL